MDLTLCRFQRRNRQEATCPFLFRSWARSLKATGVLQLSFNLYGNSSNNKKIKKIILTVMATSIVCMRMEFMHFVVRVRHSC